MTIVIFILVLSVLIFVHELGHFAAAKACNVYVDQFSIGMPPRVAGFQYGETDYCIGALPIGGFVKMAGQEDAPLSETERTSTYGHVPPERWFNNKPVWQRMIVLIAGPAMNLFFAIFLYGLIAAMGEEVPEFEVSARLGMVEPDSPAAKAPLYRYEEGKALAAYTGEPDTVGWKPGDQIVEVNGKPMENIRDIAIEAILHGAGTEHTLLIERPQVDGPPLRFLSRAAPVLRDGEDYPMFGVAPYQTAQVGEVMAGMPAGVAGLQPGDIIERAEGEFVSWDTFQSLVTDFPAGQPVELVILRGEERLTLSMVPQDIGRLRGIDWIAEENASLEEAVPVVANIESDREIATGIKRKDRIAGMNGEKLGVTAFLEHVRGSAGDELELDIERPAILFGLVQRSEQFKTTVTVDTVRAIGITFQPITVHRDLPAWQIVPEAFRRTSTAVSQILLTLKALVLQNVSVKDLGGPVMIAQATTQAAEGGLSPLLRMTAFISLNLCIFNLLPLPVLDGGQLVINGLEAVRRKPLSPMILERVQQVGVVFILMLMLFVTYNDIGRWINTITP